MYPTLISASQLQALLKSDQPCMVFDCTFDLSKPDAGEQQYAKAHIPGAVYAHLDTALSAPHTTDLSKAVASFDRPASGGRHPLPSRERFAAWLSSKGFSNDMQAVVYDRNGVNFCGRLWWMLHWLGHEGAAVLDGGLQAWQAAGGGVSEHLEAKPRTNFALKPALVNLVDAAYVLKGLGRAELTLIDARAAPRFKGEVEPLDPVAGHIPGALNRPFSQNLDTEGRFKSAEQLRAEFTALLGPRDPASVVHHCGSGVSALPNLLAMQIAGLGGTALYAGSWSDWCKEPNRPVAKG